MIEMIRYPGCTPINKKLMPFQITGVINLAERKHNLLADEMGLGKTVQAICLMNMLKLRKVLIITPASIKRNWEHKLNEWLTEGRIIQIIDKKTDFISEFAEVVIVNYDLISHSYLHQQLTERKWDLLICDEAHRLKNMKAKRTVAVLSRTGLAHKAERTLMMTGTPVLNRPIELYPILRVLAPKVMAPYSDYFKYGRRYCAGYMDGFAFNVDGASHTDELNKKLREHYMIRRMTYEVEVQLPKRRHEVIFIDSTKDIQNRLRTLDEATRKDFKHQTFDGSAGELATLRRETAEAKIDTSIEIIRDYIEAVGKIVIFAYHHSVIEKLEKELATYNPVTLSGSTLQIHREGVIRKFSGDPNCRVFIGQIQAAGEGIDGLQKVCSNILFVEWSWVPGEIEQAIKRVHRIGQERAVLIRFLVWANSIEEHQMRVALDKVKTIKEIVK